MDAYVSHLLDYGVQAQYHPRWCALFMSVSVDVRLVHLVSIRFSWYYVCVAVIGEGKGHKEGGGYSYLAYLSC